MTKFSCTNLWAVLLVFAFSATAFAADAEIEKKKCTNAYPENGPFYAGKVAQTRPRADGPLRIVSYNVNFATEIEKLTHDLNDLPQLKDADIILLQEVEGDKSGANNAAQELAETLSMNYVFAPAILRDKSGRDYGNAILTRFPIERYKKIVLPESDWETCNQRIGLQATLTVGDRHIEVISLHMSVLFNDSAGREASRARQAVPVLAETAKIDPRTPVIVTGDLNTVNGTGWRALAEMFYGQGFINGHIVEKTTTFKWAPFHLDHMFVRNLCTTERGVARQAQGSDHYPIWSHMVLDLDHQCPKHIARTGS